MVLGIALALARPATHTVTASPPAAHYVFDQRASCPATVLVSPKGDVLEVTVEGCPDILADGIAAAAARWRFAKATERTLETIDVAVRPPSFPPRAGGKDCLLAFVVDGDHVARLTPQPPRHCSVRAPEGAPQTQMDRRTTAWCRIDVADDGTPSIQDCAEGFDGPSLTWVESLELDPRARAWTLLLGFRP